MITRVNEINIIMFISIIISIEINIIIYVYFIVEI